MPFLLRQVWQIYWRSILHSEQKPLLSTTYTSNRNHCWLVQNTWDSLKREHCSILRYMHFGIWDLQWLRASALFPRRHDYPEKIWFEMTACPLFWSSSFFSIIETMCGSSCFKHSPAPLRMPLGCPQILALNTNTSINSFLGHPKWCRTFVFPSTICLVVCFLHQKLDNPQKKTQDAATWDLGRSGEVSRTLALKTLQSQADSLDTLEAVDGLVATAWDGEVG